MIHRIQMIMLFLLLLGCQFPPGNSMVLPSTVEADSTSLLSVPTASYLATTDSAPQDTQYFGLINSAMPLNADELALLTQNGFVISDRLQWNRFVEAYAWIYKQDLPVIITSDSILHAFHQSYINLVQSLEISVLLPELRIFLRETIAVTAATAASIDDPMLAPYYHDVEDYLTVALILLDGTALTVDDEPYRPDEYGDYAPSLQSIRLDVAQLRTAYGPRIAGLVKLAWQADTVATMASAGMSPFFNQESPIDFTLFQPRAHYTKSMLLANYFRAITWLAQVDYRFVDFDPLTGETVSNPAALAAAKILHDAILEANQRERWEMINKILEFLVGRSDNMMLPDLERLFRDMGWDEPHSVLLTAPAETVNQLLSHDYGQQRITGQLRGRHIANTDERPVARSVSFMLFGQRFALDSWILGNVVYDRLIVDGEPVARALPTGFDLMAALGNDRAVHHLTEELATYQYESTVATLRQQVDALDVPFWQASLYSRWLQLIRTLNPPTIAATYPAAMRTAAWADKTLQTQLGAWAQLRHDNLLYAKQSHTSLQILCEFPAVYVEPYPALYQSLAAYAIQGQQLVQMVATTATPEPLNLTAIEQYFVNVAESAGMLATISAKELTNNVLTADEINFLKSLVTVQEYTLGCGGASFEEMWDGWYMHLIYGKDDSPALIADVHTNPNNDPQSALYPPRVLHVGTGPATAMFMIVETAAGPSLFVGPVYAYYEFVEVGYPPMRLNDEAWRARLADPVHYPIAPAWVNSFRLPIDAPPTPFALPKHQEYRSSGK